MSTTALNLTRRHFGGGTRKAAYMQQGNFPGPNPNRSDVFAALLLLPERQRQAVVLHYFLDCSVASVADLMGPKARKRPISTRPVLPFAYGRAQVHGVALRPHRVPTCHRSAAFGCKHVGTEGMQGSMAASEISRIARPSGFQRVYGW